MRGDDAVASRRLFLIWQNPDTRKFVRVGVLSELVDGRYVYEYTDGAHGDGFHPLVQFPDLDRVYVSRGLPAFFVNRLMNNRRPSYPDYLNAIGVDSPDLETPMELLARTGGPRFTDTFHLVDDFTSNDDGLIVTRFLASGIRHIAGSDDALKRVHPGDRLELRAERENPVNRRALLVCAVSDEALGYVPDWLLEDLTALRARSESFEIYAERVSPDEHPHMRLLCRVEAEAH
ncbi:hypothetical protein HH308_17210 [Gordonia sp. TBRC 11910]|uniref:HIRAN domain-containing protein n=1 Tax=Gordonia asplenii TaxID=2725283 RepID=A0A848L2X3_9ACTN|nr:HIRAN domain-containing protein [Gordonia asplenii]NMO02953.1 hypothetical protein [Gordonia asplenii]